MTAPQPQWKFLENLGDVSPIDYGGFFVYVDETGVYEAEAELLIAPESDEGGTWTVYRFSLERCTFVNGILSDNKFHPEHPAWFAQPETERAKRPQDTTYLSTLESWMSVPVSELVEMFCSENPLRRAHGYQIVGEHHGFENFDSYPLTFTSRQEVEKRYQEETAR